MVNLDIIQESQSDWSLPVILVPKRDGSRELKLSKFDVYPMPRIVMSLTS